MNLKKNSHSLCGDCARGKCKAIEVYRKATRQHKTERENPIKMIKRILYLKRNCDLRGQEYAIEWIVEMHISIDSIYFQRKHFWTRKIEESIDDRRVNSSFQRNHIDRIAFSPVIARSRCRIVIVRGIVRFHDNGLARQPAFSRKYRKYCSNVKKKKNTRKCAAGECRD